MRVPRPARSAAATGLTRLVSGPAQGPAVRASTGAVPIRQRSSHFGPARIK
jgi:hypothetical protein